MPRCDFRPWLDAGAEPMIRIEKVAKSFGDFVAVDDVSLDIYRGELFALLGGSGSGKTTLLRMLAGFERPSAGRILIGGADMSEVPPYERPVNMMFQSYALFPHMTVEQNVAFGLKQDGLPKAEIRQRVEEGLALVQMTSFARRKPHQLSGGQRQRVALMRSLVKRPKVLLLDEPLGALDKKLREQTQFELVRIQEQVGITFVMVTHDQEEAMTMATRIGVMKDGNIVQVGPPPELYEFPRTRYIADFVGSVNLFEGTLSLDEPNRAVIACPGIGLDVHVSHGVTGTPGMTFWVAVRPEKIRLGREPDPATPNRLQGTIEEIGYLGDSSIYQVRLPGGALVRVTAANADRWSESEWGWGETAHLSWRSDAGVVLTQ